MAAVTSPLRAICWPFASHFGALKGNAFSRLIGLVGMNEVAERRCVQQIVIRGADAAARGAMGTIESRIPVAYQTEFNPHTRPRSIRAGGGPGQSDEQAAPTGLSITRAVSAHPSPI